MVIAGIQQQWTAGVGEQLLLPQETSAPPSRAACSCCLCQPVKVNGPYFRSQYFQRPVSWDTGHACESTRNFLLPRNTRRVGRTDKVWLGTEQQRLVTDSGTRTEVGCLEQHSPFMLTQVPTSYGLSRMWEILKLLFKKYFYTYYKKYEISYIIMKLRAQEIQFPKKFLLLYTSTYVTTSLLPHAECTCKNALIASRCTVWHRMYSLRQANIKIPAGCWVTMESRVKYNQTLS